MSLPKQTSLSSEPQSNPSQKEDLGDDLVIDTLPNRLTALRILVVPAVTWCLWEDHAIKNIIGMILFSLAAITDYFDGYYARTRKISTIMGKLIDPLADKLLVLCAFVMLQWLHRMHPVIVMILVGREFVITGLRAIASAEGIVIPASQLAKWKTATQMVAIPMLILGDHFLGLPLIQIGTWLLYVSLLISIWSLKDYVVDFFRELYKGRQEKLQKRKLAKQAKQQRKFEKKAARVKRWLSRSPELDQAVKDLYDKGNQ